MRIHFIGIKGVSMRFLAAFEQSLGHIVSGSDLTLEGHKAENVENCDLVVYTGAVPWDNPELQRARELNLPIIERAALLGQIAPLFDKTIALSGTHGKTTTTGMLWNIASPLNPTVHIGGAVGGKNGVIGGRELFITEACEYHRSFLNLRPDIGVVLNIDLDHTDCYKNLGEMTRSFKDFATNSSIAIVNGDDPNCATLSGRDDTYSFGISDKCLYHAQNISIDKSGVRFAAYRGKERLGNITLGLYGKHNIYNALAAVAVSDVMDWDFSLCVMGLKNFVGVERRFELIALKGGLRIYSDYSHHPSEIAACLNSALTLDKGKITVVFEPHTYSRTKSFLSGFVEALSKADEVILAPVFAAREAFASDVSSTLIARKLIDKGVHALSFDTYCEIEDYLYNNVKEGILIFMGAGDIDKAAHAFAEGNISTQRIQTLRRMI